MTISGVNGVSTQAGQLGINQAVDSYSRNIQNQIAAAQKKLQELSSNEELSLEDKMKKRQEIQQEITNLNQQLRQHQMEQRREANNTAQKHGNSMNDMLGGNRQVQTKAGRNGARMQSMSRATMSAIISADVSMGQVQVQSQVRSSLEGRAGVLESEIKQEAGGKSREAKEAELSEIEDKVNDVTAAQMSTLSDINEKLEQAAKEDGSTKPAEERKTNGESTKADGIGTDASEEVTGSTAAAETAAGDEGTPEGAAGASADYTHVDIKL